MDAFGVKVSEERQKEIIQRFAFLNIKGKVRLKDAERVFCVIEEVGLHVHGNACRIFFGRLVRIVVGGGDAFSIDHSNPPPIAAGWARPTAVNRSI